MRRKHHKPSKPTRLGASSFVYLALLFQVLNFSNCGNNDHDFGDRANSFLPSDIIEDEDRPELDNILPADQVSDELGDKAFKFSAFLNVKLEIQLELYELVENDSKNLSDRADYTAALLEGDNADAVVVITPAKSKKIVFTGKIDRNGKISSSFQIPAGKRNYEMKIAKSGFIDRSVKIENLPSLSKIGRKMGIGQTRYSKQNYILDDTDEDGIPDIYDAFPSDPYRTFSYDIPAENYFTVAFEDNFPEVGDADYNDFIARYQASITKNANNQTVSVTTNVEALARAAGYTHTFGMKVRFHGHSANITVVKQDYRRNDISESTSQATDKANIIVFDNTKDAFHRPNGGGGIDNGYQDEPRAYGEWRKIVIYFDEPLPDGELENAPFDPYLLVHETGYDVHLVGKRPIENSNNPHYTIHQRFLDSNGYPRALLVPLDWAYPREFTHIEDAYPKFTEWRDSLGQSASDWYLPENRVDNEVIIHGEDVQVVTTDGGRIESRDGSISITFPPGAVDETTIFTLDTNVEPPFDYIEDDNAQFQNEPLGKTIYVSPSLELIEPAELCYDYGMYLEDKDYDQADLEEFLNKVFISFADEETKQYVVLETEMDTANKKICGKIPHFSFADLAIQIATPNFQRDVVDNEFNLDRADYYTNTRFYDEVRRPNQFIHLPTYANQIGPSGLTTPYYTDFCKPIVNINAYRIPHPKTDEEFAVAPPQKIVQPEANGSLNFSAFDCNPAFAHQYKIIVKWDGGQKVVSTKRVSVEKIPVPILTNRIVVDCRPPCKSKIIYNYKTHHVYRSLLTIPIDAKQLLRDKFGDNRCKVITEPEQTECSVRFTFTFKVEKESPTGLRLESEKEFKLVVKATDDDSWATKGAYVVLNYPFGPSTENFKSPGSFASNPPIFLGEGAIINHMANLIFEAPAASKILISNFNVFLSRTKNPMRRFFQSLFSKADNLRLFVGSTQDGLNEFQAYVERKGTITSGQYIWKKNVGPKYHQKIIQLTKTKIKGVMRDYVTCIGSSNITGEQTENLQDLVCVYGDKFYFNTVRKFLWDCSEDRSKLDDVCDDYTLASHVSHTPIRPSSSINEQDYAWLSNTPDKLNVPFIVKNYDPIRVIDVIQPFDIGKKTRNGLQHVDTQRKYKIFIEKTLAGSPHSEAHIINKAFQDGWSDFRALWDIEPPYFLTRVRAYYTPEMRRNSSSIGCNLWPFASNEGNLCGDGYFVIRRGPWRKRVLPKFHMKFLYTRSADFLNGYVYTGSDNFSNRDDGTGEANVLISRVLSGKTYTETAGLWSQYSQFVNYLKRMDKVCDGKGCYSN